MRHKFEEIRRRFDMRGENQRGKKKKSRESREEINREEVRKKEKKLKAGKKKKKGTEGERTHFEYQIQIMS